MSEVLTRVDEGERMKVTATMSQPPRVYPDVRDKFNAMQVRAEHQRLQSAVVEAATKWRKLRSLGYADSVPVVFWAYNDLDRAVDALIAFEAENGIGGDK